MFADRGRSISLEASETLVSAVGKDLRRLSVEIDKAVAFAGERVEITNADIEAVASTTAPTSIFEFTDALADRDCRRALALAADLIGSGESVFGLQAMAVRTVRDLIAVESLIGRGASTGEMMAAAGRPEFVVRKLTRQVRNFDSGQLVDALRAAAQTDAEMKTSRDARLAFERWIVRTCTG
jgi:DNA polymerase-3 subunit delta